MASNTAIGLESVTWLQDELHMAKVRYYIVSKSVFVTLALSAVLLSFVSYGLADYIVRFPRVIRILITIGLGAGAVFLFKRFSSRVMENLDDEEKVACRVETVKEKEGDSLRSLLICALQFGTRRKIPGAVDLKNETIRLARDRCRCPSKVAIHDRKLVKRAMQSIGGILLIYLVWGIFFFPGMKAFLLRALAFNVRYPTATKIVSVKYESDAPMRADYPIEVHAQGRLPFSGRVTVAYKGQKKFNVTLAQDEENQSIYHAVISSPLKFFKFRVRLGDYTTDEYPVHINVPPFIQEGQIEVRPPRYTGVQPTKNELRNICAPEGSTLAFRVKPNRPVRTCALFVEDEMPKIMKKEGDSYVGSLELKQSTSLSLLLTDREGLQNSERLTYYMTVKSDQLPMVELVEPDSGSFLSSFSRIRFLVDVKDDYGIDSAKIIYKLYRSQQEGEENIEKVIKQGEMPVKLTGAGQTANGHLSKLVRDFVPVHGDRIGFTAVARDNCPGKDRQGESDEISVFVVSPDELRAIIAKGQKRVVDLVAKLRDEERRQAETIQKRLNKL